VRILLFGAGAVGSVLGALLARGGADVFLVGRASHIEAIRADGLTVEGRPGPPQWLAGATGIPAGARFDRILLTVKAPDIDAAGRSIAAALPDPVPLLALENGLGIRARTVSALRSGGWSAPDLWVVRGILRMGATLLGPGHVRLAGEGDVALGPEDRAGPAAGFEAMFASAGFPVRRVDSIEAEEWQKALVNAALNPVTADHGIENGRLLDDPYRGQALRLLTEARRVAEAEGFPIAPEAAERALFGIARDTKENRSSMLQDVERGRPTEIDAISGEILRRGARHGLALPDTERAIARIRRRTAAARGG
jgi:2-dehydropantoate 2-reductase